MLPLVWAVAGGVCLRVATPQVQGPACSPRKTHHQLQPHCPDMGGGGEGFVALGSCGAAIVPSTAPSLALCPRSVQEFMTFTSQLIAERSALGSRASVKEQEYLCHVYVRSDGLAGVVIADNEYPQRVCFTLLDKVLDEFSRQVSKMDWPSGSPATISYSALDGYLSKYQNPRDADPMTRVQAELDETKIILHNTMESLLERGEKLDDLVSKSEVLGAQSKAFYKTARKQNSCCEIM
ncbi:PREDICTED: synaptobrevin homolog YKT6 isoform X1 [Sturnus vulgaris]|uniref:synaptobrevin homolog YKT6 isoform X1 n=1 Tax=Sturnus vulgaris TaxID=9172 RepID=UPI00071A7B37|nr:PREDICTED: synaptobrevin homolog YKT6 isoform X1 [Sturnus vulgaris]